MAERIQRRREKDWRMPDGALYVGRPSKWGSPFVLGRTYSRESELWRYIERAFPTPVTGWDLFDALTIRGRQFAVDAYAFWLPEMPHLMCSLDELRGRDLCCYCPLDQPCHADVLLELANQEARIGA